ncbi:MAG TPA: YcxB family protein [Gammaproteobacteria bacterium]|jgi:hypothetical protein
MLTITPQSEDAMALIWMRRRKIFTGKVGVLIWLGAICAVGTGGALVLFGPDYGIPASYGYWMLGLYGWVWAVAIISAAFTPWVVRRRFEKFKLAGQSYTIDWDDSRLTQQSSNTKSDFPWGQFTSWSEDKKLIVLVFEQIRKLYIPKRVFDASGLKDFQHLLETKIGPMGVMDCHDARAPDGQKRS